jgi:hypothetical protein
VRLALRPRPLAVLRYLVAHAGAGISCTSLSMAGYGVPAVLEQ